MRLIKRLTRNTFAWSATHTADLIVLFLFLCFKEAVNDVWMKANKVVLMLKKKITNNMILMCMQSEM